MNETISTDKHTPGPWLKEPGVVNDPDLDDAEFFICASRDHGDDVIATVCGPIACGSPDANARLIVAAPQLLRLVRLFLDVTNINGLEPVDGNFHSIVEQAEGLLARIDGVTE